MLPCETDLSNSRIFNKVFIQKTWENRLWEKLGICAKTEESVQILNDSDCMVNHIK